MSRGEDPEVRGRADGALEPSAPARRPAGDDGAGLDRRRTERRRPVAGSPEAETLHDLRQPLSAVLALVEVGLATPDAPEPLRRLLDRIEDQSHAMRDLLDGPSPSWARPQRDVRDVVRRAVEAAQLTFRGSVALTVDTGPRLVDPAVWTRVADNLLSNAVRAAGAHGRVEVVLSGSDDRLELAVADSGPGFGASIGRSSLGLGAVSRLACDVGGHVELHRSSLGGALVKVVVPAQ